MGRRLYRNMQFSAVRAYTIVHGGEAGGAVGKKE